MAQRRETDQAPSALRYMLQALRPRPGWDGDRGFPELQQVWRGFRIDREQLGAIRRLSGGIAADDDRLAILLPQVTGFRLAMATLTHPAWPLPIWRALPTAPAAPAQLDLWIRGPVFYRGELRLRAAPQPAGGALDFGLWVDADARPALVGSWRGDAVAAPTRA
jgi:hypothetical protein